MLKGQDIICISSIDWEFIWQGHQIIMSRLAESGNRVLFIENTGVRAPNLRDLPRIRKRIFNWFHSVKGIRQERENLYVYSPIILPFPYSRIARLINRLLIVGALKRWMRSFGFAKPVVWTFLPTGIVLDILDALDPKVVVYYCIDNFSASSLSARKIKATESAVAGRADLVFVTAKNLYDWAAQYNRNVHLFPFGVDMDVYMKAASSEPKLPADMAGIARPIIGYVGGIHKWIDLDLVKKAVIAHPDKSFVFVGPLQTDVGSLKEMRNVHFLGQKKYGELPAYVTHFDVCTIPYLITDYTKNVYPTKINEYLSLGKSVVSSAIPEVVAFNERNDGIISVAKTPDEFVERIGFAAAAQESKEIRCLRRDVAVRESDWSAKIEKMSGLIESAIEARACERQRHWKESLLGLYRVSTRRVALIAIASLAVYGMIFHTPALWYAAAPLEMSSSLEKADAIIVFAGGVGESGRPNQGYEERVKYAVELYKEGYARSLIFSSGFAYAFKEAEVMRALAVSLGVPSGAIRLEEKAKNTYENVVRTVAILKESGGQSAIVVSSPYHMRRVFLVARHSAEGVDLVYAPIPTSIFFGNRRTVLPRHIAAIAHEYAGIAYYWFNGYI